ncbi:MAG: hypothetical protein JJU02_09180 [Cryomorphaceae bacterium]|nr:hypothetical protein [Cryomorphaceae bacterium]
MKSEFYLIFLTVFLFMGCSNESPEITPNTSGGTSVVGKDKENEVVEIDDWKIEVIGDSIEIKVPQNWDKTNAEMFSLGANCEKKFCENLVVYILDNVNQYTKMELGETFLKSMSANYQNFRLIHSEISTPDSLEMSFDYFLVRQGLKLGGTTYILVSGEGNNAIVFNFMGYNGSDGNYFYVRKVITEIINSIKFK